MFSKNYFEVFGFSITYDIDLKKLGEQYHVLQRTLHPDKYMGATDAEKRLSVQMSSFVNTAYQVLLNPVDRARYFLECQKTDLDLEHTTISDSEFLIQQMNLRERLNRIVGKENCVRDAKEFRFEIEELFHHEVSLFRQVSQKINNKNLNVAIDTYYKMQFLDKLNTEISSVC